MSSIDHIFAYSYNGIFWLALGIVCSFMIMNGLPQRYAFLGRHTAYTLYIFGFAEIFDNFSHSYLDLSLWFLMIKLTAAMMLVISTARFAYMRDGEG